MTSPYVIEDDAGAITVTPSALAQLVTAAAESAPGARLRRRRGLDVEVEDGRARVALELCVRYGVVIPETARDVQARVAEALRRSCGLDAAVDVSVEELDE